MGIFSRWLLIGAVTLTQAPQVVAQTEQRGSTGIDTQRLAVLPQQENASSALQALVRSPGYQNNVARLFATLSSDLFQRCPTLVSHGSQVTVIQPPSFAPDGYPTSGFWKQSFPVSGCGNDTTINLFFQGKPDEKVDSIVGIPGETHTSLVLQRDAFKYLTVSLQAVMNGCPKFTVLDSKYLGGVRRPTEPWDEAWTVAGCARRAKVVFTFIPNSTGATIATKPAILID